MFRFDNPEYLWLLAAVVILAIIRILTYYSQNKRLRRFGDPKLIKLLTPDVSRLRQIVKFIILEIALTMIIFSLARPQQANGVSSEKRSSIEAIIAIDISNSMRATDVKPSRLERAKMMIENLLEDHVNDKIGLVVFAGDAFLQLPITSDYVSAKMFLDNIDPSMISYQGTDIAAAINLASNCFTQQQHIGKAIIVITDGEDHEGGVIESAHVAKEKGQNVYVLGVGSINGAPIPDTSSENYMSDQHGKIVMSKLNEQMCKEIAQAGGGAYIHIDNNPNAQRNLNQELDKLEQGETITYSDYSELFQYAAGIALLLLIIEVCILNRKNPLIKKIKLFDK